MTASSGITKTFLQYVAPPLAFLLLVCVGWHLFVVWFEIQLIVMPGPGRVLAAFKEHSDKLLGAAWITGRAALCGFGCSLLIGTAVSFVFAQLKWVRRSCYPYAIVLQTVPVVAVAPIIINWYGRGFHSIVLVATIISLFPVITNVTTGLTSVPPSYIDLFRVHQATSWQTQFKLRFPFALRYLIVGAKTSSGLAVVGSIVGEFFAGESIDYPGLGYVIQSSVRLAQTDVLFAAVILSAFLGIAMFLAVSAVGSTVLRRWTRP